MKKPRRISKTNKKRRRKTLLECKNVVDSIQQTIRRVAMQLQKDKINRTAIRKGGDNHKESNVNTHQEVLLGY